MASFGLASLLDRAHANPAHLEIGFVRRVFRIACYTSRLLTTSRLQHTAYCCGLAPFGALSAPPRYEPSAHCLLPTLNWMDDCADLYGLRRDVRPCSRTKKRDRFKTRLSLTCPSCTIMSCRKSHPNNRLRRWPNSAAFFPVCHRMSRYVTVVHGITVIFSDRLGSMLTPNSRPAMTDHRRPRPAFVFNRTLRSGRHK